MKTVIDNGAFIPTKAHEHDAGFDIKSPVDCTVAAGSSAIIDTGVHIELPLGTVGMLKSKSGLNVKHGIVSEGVIDAGYTGSICVKLYNHSSEPYSVKRGDKITQLVILPYVYTEIEQAGSLEETERGNNGFGSSGR